MRAYYGHLEKSMCQKRNFLRFYKLDNSFTFSVLPCVEIAHQQHMATLEGDQKRYPMRIVAVRGAAISIAEPTLAFTKIFLSSRLSKFKAQSQCSFRR